MSVPQQAFLRDAMRRMNLTRDGFASRIGVSRRALDTWLLPDDSQESRTMPEIVERFVAEIVVKPEAAEPYTQSVDSQSLASHMLFEGKPQLLSVDQFSRDSVDALFRVADIMQPSRAAEKFRACSKARCSATCSSKPARARGSASARHSAGSADRFATRPASRFHRWPKANRSTTRAA